MSTQLAHFFLNHISLQQDEVLQSFVDEVNQLYPDAVLGILFYGSSMRSKEYQNSILDFYVVVTSYSKTYDKFWYRFANHVLPPNVFYIQTTIQGKTYRAKYAVVSNNALINSVQNSFHSYFWARFIQPMKYVYAREQGFEQWFANIQTRAANKFYQTVMPLIQTNISSRNFWLTGLQLTYSAELRAESDSRAKVIYENNVHYYDGMFENLRCFKDVDIHLRNAKLKWKIRIYYGKILSVLRLMKATSTFEGGVEYIAWKIERHTGEPIVLTDKMRKYPWIFIWPVVFDLIKRGLIR